jgi:hypothetical protein
MESKSAAAASAFPVAPKECWISVWLVAVVTAAALLPKLGAHLFGLAWYDVSKVIISA